MCYPTVVVKGKVDANHSVILREFFREAPDRMGLDAQVASGQVFPRREQRRAKFGEHLVNFDRVVIAAEAVSVFSARELQHMKAWFEGLGFSIRLICHVRHLRSWLNSMVAQRVVGQMALTIGEAVSEFERAAGIVRPRIETLRKVFPDAEFYNHELATKHEFGPAGFFFETIGLPRPEAVPRVNEGRSDTAIRAISIVNERFGRAHWQGPIEKLAEHIAHPGMQAIREIPGPKFMLRRDEVKPIEPLVENENEWLSREFGPKFRDSQAVFEQEAYRWSREDLALIADAAAKLPAQTREWLVERGLINKT